MIDPSTIRLDEFLPRWYGTTEAVGAPPPAWLPGPLRHWFELTSRLGAPRTTMKRVVPPEEIRAEDGKAIFLLDPTGDWRWAFDVDEPGVVYDAELYEDWRRNEESLEQLLVHHAVQEAVYGARHASRRTQVPEDELGAMLAGLEQVDFPKWRWPSEDDDYRYFLGDRVVAEVVPDYGPAGFFQVAAASPDAAGLSSF